MTLKFPCQLAIIVPEDFMQASRREESPTAELFWVMQTAILTGICDCSMNILGVTNRFLIRFKSWIPGGNLHLVLETQSESHSCGELFFSNVVMKYSFQKQFVEEQAYLTYITRSVSIREWNQGKNSSRNLKQNSWRNTFGGSLTRSYLAIILIPPRPSF